MLRVTTSGQDEAQRCERGDSLDRLERQAADRVPDLLPIRCGRLLSSHLTVQLCGRPPEQSRRVRFAERRLVFDLNDVDETHPGPFEWDVKRVVTSHDTAVRQNGMRRKHRRRSSWCPCGATRSGP
jgi:hypothetical protein